MRILRRGNRTTLWVPAGLGHLRAISSFVKGWLASHEAYRSDAEKCYLVELAVVEACTNVIRHAALAPAADSLAVSLKRSGGDIEILILDRGPPFDPTRVPDPDLSRPREGGYGIFLIRSIMHRVRYRRIGGRWNRLQMFHDPSARAPCKGTDPSREQIRGDQRPGKEDG